VIRIIRRLLQFLTLILLISIPYINDRQINIFIGNLFSLTIFGVDISDPLIFLQYLVLNHNFEAKFFLSILIPVILAISFGRVFCSFLCPVNTVFEIVNKFSLKNKKVPVKGNNKTILLLLSLMLFVLVSKHPIFNYLSLPGLLSIELQKVISFKLFSLFWAIFFGLVLLDYFSKRRFWCNFICPQGIFLSFLKTPWTLKIVREKSEALKCLNCRKCVLSCPFNLNPMEKKIYPQCTNCMECVITCRKNHRNQSPLSFKFF
jgi:ferredoxin-type protein NapH